MAAVLLLDHLLDDVRALDPPWLSEWEPHVTMTTWRTQQCVGAECTAVGAPSPAAVCDMRAASPQITVPVPADDDARTHITVMLNALGAPVVFGYAPDLCAGSTCARCRPAGVSCGCGSECAAAKADHALQPTRRRYGVWPPPELLFVHIGRVAAGDRLRRGRVEVPRDAFPVDELCAEPPQRPGDEWKPARAWYRALSAAYHQPVDIPGHRPSPNGGHYWAIVRGVERGAGGALVAGYRRMNDHECVGGAEMDAALSGPRLAARWGTPEAERRVSMLVLQRVDNASPGPSPSEGANRLAPSMQFDDGRNCPKCTLFNKPGRLACGACLAPLPRSR